VCLVGEVVLLGLWNTVTNLLLAGLNMFHEPIVSVFDGAFCRHHCRWRNNIFFLFDNQFLLDRRCLGCSGCSGIFCILWTYCEEDEFHSMRDYLATQFWWSNNQNYLWYLIEMITQSNNDTMGYRLINIITFLDIWLAQKNITHYLILEGMDCIGHVTLLADTMISSLLKPPDVVWLRVWCCRQPQLFGDLNWDEVLLAIVINNEMQQGPFHPHLSMEEVLPLFRIYWFFWLNYCGCDSCNGVSIDDLSSFNIFWIRFWI